MIIWFDGYSFPEIDTYADEARYVNGEGGRGEGDV